MRKNQTVLTIVLLLVVFAIGFYASTVKTEAATYITNTYEYSFSEIVNDVNNIEAYLANAMISKDPNHAAETLSKIWNYSNMALVYFGNIPFDSSSENQTIKFLNQVSDYSYTLSRKSINGEELTEKDFENLDMLHKYSLDLCNTINQISKELYSGEISWGDLSDKDKFSFIKKEEVSVFTNIQSNFDDYEGLIYDGAYSNYQEKTDKLGLVGEEIDEKQAKNRVEEILGKEEINEIKSHGLSMGGDIESYMFSVDVKEKYTDVEISISKKGGFIVEMIRNRDVKEHKLSDEEAVKKGSEFLDKQGFVNMIQTYYLIQDNVITINYAYEENGIVMYPDLIKVKVALDNGEILGVETKGYLNSHTNRNLPKEVITIEEARTSLNPNLEIISERKAVIPKDDKSEKYCYEFIGRVKEREFLVYINVENGREEEILIILETEGGTLTI